MSKSLLLVGALLVCLDVHAESLRVVTTSMEPFFFQDNGETRGIEYDILRYYAKTEGRTLEIVWVDSFQDVLPALERGDADVAAAAITITEARKERFDFSSSYFPSQLVLVQHTDETADHLGSLTEGRIGVLAGSTSVEAISSVDIELVPGEDIAQLYEAAEKGDLEGVVSSTARALLLLQEFPTLTVSLYLGEKEEFGFAFSRGSPLASSLSAHIAEIKASGIYFRLLETYLGPDAAKIVQAGSR